jgi:multidrug resistance protein MdtO
LSAIAVEYLFGTRHPAEELKREMQKRLIILSRFFHALAEEEIKDRSLQLRPLQNTIVQYAHAGDRHLNKLYNRLRDSSVDVSAVPVGIHYRIGLLTRVLEKSALIGLTDQRTARNRAYFAALAAQCDRLLDEDSVPGELFASDAPIYLREVHSELLQYAATTLPDKGDRASDSQEPLVHSSFLAGLFLPNAFQTADGVIYALKLTLAAMACYVFYSAIAWPGILTCVVTVLFTGLSSTGAMKQKQLYRFSGAAIGGTLGIATVSLLFPNMDSITSLVLVVGAVSLLSGWVLRSPQMGYVGVQIGFAFFLVTLPGFRAATLIAPARDRVIGIAIGILVMWFIFDQLWPVRTSAALSEILRRISEAAAQLRQAEIQRDADKEAKTLSNLRASVSLELASMQQLESAAHFDFGPDHKREFAASRRLIRQIEEAASDFYSTALRMTNGTNPESP